MLHSSVAIAIIVRAAVYKLLQAVITTAVPLVVGVFCALVSGALYTALLTGADLKDFFASAAQVGIGVLIGLVVDERFVVSDGAWDTDLIRRLRGGTLVLTALGTVAALLGLLFGSAAARGVAFAVTWAGLAAGIIGLFLFIIGDPEAAATPKSRGEKIVEASGSGSSAAALPPPE